METAQLIVSTIRDSFEELPRWSQVVVGGCGGLSVYFTYKILTAKRKSPLKADWKRDVVYLYQFARIGHGISLSPFCAKLETYLRMKNVKYENVTCSLATRSLEGTLPFVELNGVEYGDSQLVIQHLEAVYDGLYDAALTAEQHGIGRAVVQMLENSTLHSLLLSNSKSRSRAFQYMREKYHETDASVLHSVVKDINLAFVLLRIMMSQTGDIRSRLQSHGIGRHTDDVIEDIGMRDLKALSAVLGSKPFLLGSEPSAYDAAVYGIVQRLLDSGVPCPEIEYVTMECSNLVEYSARMRERFWPDFDTARKDEPLIL